MKKIGILVALMTLLMVGIASALTYSVVVQNPTASEHVSGVYTFNATIQNDTSIIGNSSNCSIMLYYMGGVNVANSSWSYIGYTGDVAVIGTSNTTYNTLKLTDSSIATVYAECRNISNQSIGATSSTTTYVIDNTVPTCTFASTLVSKAKYNTEQTWSITGINATTGALQFGSNTPYTLTKSGTTFSYSKTVTEGTYKTITASIGDGVNTTTCNLDYITIDSDSTLQQVAIMLASDGQKGEEAQTTNNNTLLFGAVVLVIYIIWKRKQ